MSRRHNLIVHMRHLGEAVTRAREAKGLSRESLCRACGLADGVLADVETGMPARGFGLTELCRIAAALDVLPDSLLKNYETALVLRDRWWDAPERNEP